MHNSTAMKKKVRQFMDYNLNIQDEVNINEVKVTHQQPDTTFTPKKKVYSDKYLQMKQEADEREQLYGRVPIKNRKY